MGKKPCCPKGELKKGAWTAIEDQLLTDYIKIHGEGKWRNISNITGLRRCGKSCRLRWLNYLRPGIKRGNITNDEEDLIIRLHKLLGNRWSLIAGRLPGRTDNEIKNYWNTIIGKKLQNQKNQFQQSKSDPLPISEPTIAGSTLPTTGIVSSDKREFPSVNNINDSSDVLLDFEIDQHLLSYLLDDDSSQMNISEAANQCNYQLITPNCNEISVEVSDDLNNLDLGFSPVISPKINENCDFDWL